MNDTMLAKSSSIQFKPSELVPMTMDDKRDISRLIYDLALNAIDNQNVQLVVTEQTNRFSRYLTML